MASPEATAQAEQHLASIARVTSEGEFTVRDEANALTAFAFRNGFLEDLHAGKSSPILDQPGYSRISDDEMQRLMIEASPKLADMLRIVGNGSVIEREVASCQMGHPLSRPVNPRSVID